MLFRSIIDALRSRTKQIRISATSKELVANRLQEISDMENLQPVRGILGDIAHVSNGNLRKAVFLMELLAKTNQLDDRKNLQNIVAATTLVGIQQVIEEALRGRIHDWQFEQVGIRARFYFPEQITSVGRTTENKHRFKNCVQQTRLPNSLWIFRAIHKKHS